MRKVTLKDIAQESGVSATAVSLAMRGSARISPEKTKEINTIAKRLGYTRDPMMSALCAYRDNTRPKKQGANINFLQFGDKPMPMNTEGAVSRDFWAGALQATQTLGYNLNCLWAGDLSLTPKRMQEILISRGVAGLIFYQSNCPIDHVRPILDKFSLLWLGDGPKDASLHCVRINRFSSMHMVWEKLSNMNYQSAGLILAEHSLNQNYGEWEAAHKHYQHKYVGKPHYIPPLTFMSNQDCDPKLLNAWIKQWKPQVIVSAFSNIYPLLKELNYSIPKDIGYVSLSTKSKSGISGIDQQSETIAQTGVRLLDQLICNRELGVPPHQQIIETNGRWNPGKTLSQPS